MWSYLLLSEQNKGRQHTTNKYKNSLPLFLGMSNVSTAMGKEWEQSEKQSFACDSAFMHLYLATVPTIWKCINMRHFSIFLYCKILVSSILILVHRNEDGACKDSYHGDIGKKGENKLL